MPERPELDVVRRFYAEAINGRDSSTCERLLDADFVHNREPRGRAGQRDAVDAGREVTFTSTAVLRVDDGLIVQAWDQVDLFGLFSQIGMPPAAD